MELNKIYFYTATIEGWKHLLKDDRYKDIIIGSLRYLSDKELINVYAFVIMPNQIHIIWEMLQMNGKEMPHASLMKFTSHQFLDELRKENVNMLSQYSVESDSRNHQFWKRDALPIELYSDKVFEQKLDYIHNNPVQEKWNLSEEPVDYKYSSAKFYETERDEFGFLKHYSIWQ
ncbi:MAG TPA: transposase [Bacteroidia bacterium]|nr:transposase [Bacteroidia bacterium]